jgi:hypothetical protein
MANLSNPNFQVDILTGMPDNYQVTGTVNVELSPFEAYLVNVGLPLQLQSDIWGEDAGFNGTDDHLFSFTSQSITGPGTYTFSAIIPRGVLNEDSSWFDNRDELYDRFTLTSGSNFFPVNIATNSPEITGIF